MYGRAMVLHLGLFVVLGRLGRKDQMSIFGGDPHGAKQSRQNRNRQDRAWKKLGRTQLVPASLDTPIELVDLLPQLTFQSFLLINLLLLNFCAN